MGIVVGLWLRRRFALRGLRGSGASVVDWDSEQRSRVSQNLGILTLGFFIDGGGTIAVDGKQARTLCHPIAAFVFGRRSAIYLLALSFS